MRAAWRIQQVSRLHEASARAHLAGNFHDAPAEVKRIVPGIVIAVRVAAVVLQERQGRIPGAGFADRVDDERRPMTVVFGVDPELRFVGLAAGRIVVLQRQGRIVGVDVPLNGAP